MKRIVLALVCAFGVAAITVMADDENKTWEEGNAAFQTKTEDYKPTITVDEIKQLITFTNRGRAISTKEYTEPYTVTALWTWESADIDKDPDTLTVALRTDGTVQNVQPYDLQDGLAVEFVPSGSKGSVTLTHWKAGKATVLKTSSAVDLAPKNEHKLNIRDEGDKIVVSLNGQEALSVAVKKDDGNKVRKVALYNSGPFKYSRKVSTVSNLRVAPIKK